MAQAYVGQLPGQPVHLQGLTHHELDIRYSYHDQSSESQTSGLIARLQMTSYAVAPYAGACIAQGSLKKGWYA